MPNDLPPHASLVESALLAGDARELRLLVCSPDPTLSRETVVRALDGLHALGV
jgi:hypothetical protein